MSRNKIDYKIFIGKSFNRWKVLALGKICRRAQYLLCECDCGTQREVQGNGVTSGHSKSCGCIQKQGEGIAARNNILRSYKNRAKKIGIKFLLSLEEFINIGKQNCHYCNAQPTPYSSPQIKSGVYIANGIDRVDNSKDYEINNVVSCCEICNKAKRNIPYEDFIQWLNNLTAFRKDLCQ